MKQNKKSSYYILVILFFAVAPLFAQTHPNPPSRITPPVGLPLDGGVLVLFVAAVFYGVKKSIKKK